MDTARSPSSEGMCRRKGQIPVCWYWLQTSKPSLILSQVDASVLGFGLFFTPRATLPGSAIGLDAWR